MQPQGPYGQNGPEQPYNPAGPPQGMPGQSMTPGQPFQGDRPYMPPHPGQQIHPGQPPLPGQAPYPGYPPQPGQPQPPHPGQPGPTVPQYQMPQNRNGQPGQPDLPPPPAAATTPYDFFMQPKPIPAAPLPVAGRRVVNTSLPAEGGKTNKFALIVGGAIVLILGLTLATIFAPKDETGPKLFGLAQTQQEVIRLCTDGTKKSQFRSTRNFAITCASGVTTNQNELLAYMGTQGYEYDGKQLGAKASAEASAELKSATASSTYDDTFRDLIEEQLNDYNSLLTQQLGTTTGVNAREVLTQSQQSAELLIKMVKDDSDKTVAAPVEDVAGE